eukprot:8209846-Pyramimonas_sp.AAC.1
MTRSRRAGEFNCEDVPSEKLEFEIWARQLFARRGCLVFTRSSRPGGCLSEDLLRWSRAGCFFSRVQ